MSDQLDKAREALGLEYHGLNAYERRHLVQRFEDLVRAIIADHEEQQLHEAMHGPIADPLPKDGASACRHDGDWDDREGVFICEMCGANLGEKDDHDAPLPEEVEAGEKAEAIQFANLRLDGPYEDPDSDVSVLARQFLRANKAIADRDRRIADLERERDEAIINLRNAREGTIIASALHPGEYAELAEARNELNCTDDVPLDKGLASGIAALRYQRDQLIEWNGQNAVRAEQAEDRAEKAERERDEARSRYDQAKKYATMLFRALAPQCKPMDDLIGLLSQIDNATTALPKAEASAARLRKAVEDAEAKLLEAQDAAEWSMVDDARWLLTAALQPEPGTEEERFERMTEAELIAGLETAGLVQPAPDCERCRQERDAPRDRMIVCPTCGNKRCPKAADHRFACTGSNEPGQVGVVDPQPARGEDSPVSALGPPFEFDRYINGKLMAEGVTIEREPTLDRAVHVAARIASRGPNGEPPVLVYRSPSPDLVKVRAAGQSLANMAFNLSQQSYLSDDWRRALRDGYKAWDASLKEPHHG